MREVIKYPSHKEMISALDAFNKGKKIDDVDPYSWASTLCKAKHILFVDWVRNKITAEF